MGFSNFFVETNVIRCPSFFEFIGNMVAQSLQNCKERAKRLFDNAILAEALSVWRKADDAYDGD
ncbi:hypothetical protein, partial [Hominenteromicrobium sp.]|uniref:hypothetical protein n=1 Tax=Hominenteromicrobium sp. TaxID=3073581 RepID=UPI003AB4A03D